MAGPVRRWPAAGYLREQFGWYLDGLLTNGYVQLAEQRGIGHRPPLDYHRVSVGPVQGRARLAVAAAPADEFN
jgi:hypothetical protein